LRDQRRIEDFENKKPSIPAKRGMKASNESCRKPFDRLASSFSLTEKSVADERPRRAQPNRYPDFGLEPPSRLPAAAHARMKRGSGFWEFVAVTVAQPSRIFTGFPDI
jgi:hypothetical protein